jgi:FtsZ-interacting cell division protein ZipA
MSPWVWIVIALVVVALLAVVAVMANRKKRERNRAQAAELREKALHESTDVQKREALARETEAKAAASRAEADRKAAEAERLEAEAHQRAQAAGQRREEHQERLRQADDLDPDVKHAAPTTAPSEGGRHAGATADETSQAGYAQDGNGAHATDDTSTSGGTHRA